MSELRLNTDGHIIKFGADNDVSLTHVADTGILLNSTMQLQFNDASQFINAPSATVLDINATDEIELNATAIDINGTCDISGTFSLGGTNITTTAAELNLIDGGTARGTTAIADGDGILINDAGTMRMTTVQTVKTYMGTTFNGIDDTSSSNDDCVTITDNEVVINEDGDNQDFRVESDDQPNFFFCDASANIAGFSKHDRPDQGFVHITTASSGQGTSSANADELVIEGSGETGISILSATNASGWINFGDSGDNDIGQIQYNHDNNGMFFFTNAT